MSNETNCNRSFLLYLPSNKYNHSFSCVMVLISFLATLENGLLIAAFTTYSAIRKTASQKFLISMVVSDFLTGISVGPLYATQAINHHLASICVLQTIRVYLASIFMGTSIVTVGFISIDRAHNLIKLHNYSMKNSIVYSIIILCWIIPLINAVLSYVDYQIIFSVALFITGILIFFITLSSYIALIVALRKPHDLNNPTIERAYVKRQLKAAKTSFLILTIHMLMIFPLICDRIVIAIFPVYRYTTQRAVLLLFIMTLMVGNSLVNPLIYCARIPDVRTHMLKMFRRHRKPCRVVAVNDIN